MDDFLTARQTESQRARWPYVTRVSPTFWETRVHDVTIMLL